MAKNKYEIFILRLLVILIILVPLSVLIQKKLSKKKETEKLVLLEYDIEVVDDKFIVEIDGVEDNKKLHHMSNMKKQAILERCGYKVKRITYREWQYSQQACLDRILTIDA